MTIVLVALGSAWVGAIFSAFALSLVWVGRDDD